MIEVDRRDVKYVYLDIVAFSKRTEDEQVLVVRAMNAILIDALNHLLPDLLYITVPTGDGLCVALIGQPHTPKDIHVTMALHFLAGLFVHNGKATDNEQTRFQVRIGLNEGKDCLVTDIKGNINVIGEGINLTQRIMTAAGPDCVLAGESVYLTLKDAEQHRGKFLHHPFHDYKYGVRYEAYMYRDAEALGLSDRVPDPIGSPPSPPQPQVEMRVDRFDLFAPSFSDAHNVTTDIPITDRTTLELGIDQISKGPAYVFYFHFRSTLDEKGWVGICRAPHGKYFTGAERTDLESSDWGPGKAVLVRELIQKRWPELKGTPTVIDRLRFRGDDNDRKEARATVTVRQ